MQSWKSSGRIGGTSQPIGRHPLVLLNNITSSLYDTQSFTFIADDDGPWYLSADQREMKQQHDQPTGKIRRLERSKKELTAALNEAGVSFQQHRSYTKKELQEIARIRGVDLFQDKEIIKPGWQGQPKGLLQALREQGLIDEQVLLDKYTPDGCKDPITGVVDLQYSLRHWERTW